MATHGSSAGNVRVDRRTAIQLFRFIGVGLSNTILTLCVYWALLLLISHTWAYLAAFLVGIAYTAIVNSRVTFGIKASRRQLVAYAVLCVFLYALNGALLEVFVTMLHWDKRLAILAVIVVGIPAGFLGSRLIFKR